MYLKSYRLIALCIMGLALLSAPVKAGEAEFLELLSILRDNGTISDQDYHRLRDALLKKSGPEAVAAPAVEAADKPDDGVKVSTKGGLKVESDDGQFAVELGGRIMVDAAFYDEDKNKLGDGTELRRARIELEGTLFYDWLYELGVDFADGSADVKDAYIGYAGFSPVTLKAGQFKEPFSLEEVNSSKYTTFMERALPNAFAPGRRIGLGVNTYWDKLTVAAGLFGESFDGDADDEGDESWGTTGRVTYAPLQEKTKVLHLGAAASYRQQGDDDEVRFRARPESHVTDRRYVNTGQMASVNDFILVGLEAAGVYGPCSLQGEYMLTDVDRGAGEEDVNFDGWYVQGSWFLTGESRNYKFKKGAFDKIKPKRRIGAWEAALRYSVLDLNDGPVTGGEEENVTLGLNWYINPYMRLMANYIFVDNDENADDDGTVLGNDDPRILQFRMQAHY